MFRSQSISSSIFTADRLVGNSPAFVEPNGSSISYKTAARLVRELADHLQRAGAAPGARIAFTAPRGPLGVIGFLAAAEVGTCCPLNPRLKPDELSATLATMRIGFLLEGAGDDRLKSLADQAGVQALSVALRSGELVVPGAASGPAVRREATGAEVPAMLMATSGTTSKPKLVPISHANVLASAGAIGEAFSLGPSDLCLNPMPLYHVHGLVSASISSLLAGSAIHCTDGFSPASFDAASRALRPTWFTASPAMHLALREFHEHAGSRPPKERLRFFRSSSAPLPPSAIEVLEALFEAPLIETYGLTETASMVCTNPLPPAVRKLGSVGVAVGAEILVVNEARAACAPHEAGEIAIRGSSVIAAYEDNAAPESFFGGWLLTGDLGYLDADGYLFIVGRAKEVIKRGGLSVYPAEVDDALAASPDVAEAVTFSVPHSSLGEEVVAAVVPRAGSSVDSEALRSLVGRRLSTYKVPSVVLVVDAIPKSETGKIVRRQVAAAFADLLLPRSEPPADSTEHSLLSTWREVLGRDDVGVTDNMFLYGADPLRAGRAAELMEASGIWKPTLKDLLAAPTVRQQAALVKSV
ncbi:non-ribosomal peptide synthetase [Xanthomonas axonopodis]|uniref:non-ribosomal peptide synthetase n=1 Tax=Xanthomonas axonopodis TaxID=53413 RepID=UPI003556A554